MAAGDGETAALRLEVAALRLRVQELEMKNQRLAKIASSCSCGSKEDNIGIASLYGHDQEVQKNGKSHESRTSNHDTPRKPQYTMAPELPLILRSCLFDKISFMRSSVVNRALIEHFKGEHHQYMLQAAIFHEALSCLPFPEPSPFESHQKKRNRIPLMSRQTEPSYEEHIAKLKTKTAVCS